MSPENRGGRAAACLLLTEQNAFVKRLPDGVTYRFHHMMKACAERTFLTLDAGEADSTTATGSDSGMKITRQYLHAMAALPAEREL